MTPQLRTLFVTGMYPWPATDGYSLRMSNMVVALADAGPVDMFVAHHPRVTNFPDAPSGVRRILVPTEATARAQKVVRWLGEGQPRIMLDRTCEGARKVLAAEVSAHTYDVVCVSHVDTWWYFRDLLPRPYVVDLDNLEHLKSREGRRIRPTGASLAVTAKWWATKPFERVDESRMDRLQHDCARAADLVALCSELDVKRSGMPNAVEVPNGYELRWEPRSDTDVTDPDAPVFSFVGLQSYAPNADASRWMATVVLPRIRESIPGARFRIVGRGGETLSGLGSLPGVTVTGPVDDLRGEMLVADVAVVPIRFGAGTRLKVVEALANRIPVVTTTVGCEGIDVVDGEHVLVADDAVSFADACVRLTKDAGLRSRLADSGARLFEGSYQWSSIRENFASLLRDRAGL
jgi:glycosyltransferase involved in cell wall biosynthesis